MHQLNYDGKSRTRVIIMGAPKRFQRPDRFNPLLAQIRGGLSDYWTFHEECLDGILGAATRQRDSTAWFEQMQQLAEGNDKSRSVTRISFFFFEIRVSVHLCNKVEVKGIAPRIVRTIHLRFHLQKSPKAKFFSHEQQLRPQ